MSETIDIPERHQAFCKAIAKLAAEHGLTSFQGSYKPKYDDGWHADITFGWEAGRHGDTADRIWISSNFHVNTKIGDWTRPRY